uniref:Uncharacterized protein n=1 Tax=Caenorhabditis japonica TaxID=281687 RepID=A0A8R1E606_CAEJA
MLSAKLEKPLRWFSARVLQRCNIRYSSYHDRLVTLTLTSIRHRRLRAQLILIYKLIIGAAHFPNLNHFIKLSSSLRRPMTLLLSTACDKNFFASVVPIWNALTANTPHFLSPSEFYSLLDKNIAIL